jgi:hypothetical protein
MQEPLVHIGYHKTATTWMQAEFFVPTCGYDPILSHEEVFGLISGVHPLAFDPSPARDLIAGRVAAARQKGLTPVISSEILSGNPYRGGHDSAENARKLHRTVPGAPILITVREQEAACASMYMQYVSRGGCLSPGVFFDGPWGLGYPGFDPAHLEYHLLVARYQDLFGPENVMVCTYEEFRKAPDRFIERISTFAGNATQVNHTGLFSAPQNPSNPEYAVPVLRRANYIRTGPVSPDPLFDLGVVGLYFYKGIGRLSRSRLAAALVREKKPVRRLVRERYSGRYDASNQALARLRPDLDLGGYQGFRS